MKRFHFATIHLVMIGLILFGIATIFVRVLKSESALIFALFIIMVVVVALLHYQKTTYESLEIEQLDELNQDVEDSLKTLLGKMPVGVITFDENDHIEWFNPYAKLVLSDENGNFNNYLMPMFQKSTHLWQGLFLSLLRPSIFIIDVLKVIVFTSSPTTVF